MSRPGLLIFLLATLLCWLLAAGVAVALLALVRSIMETLAR